MVKTFKEQIMSQTQPSPLLLAYLGDSVMEVLIRERLIERKDTDSARCNREALEFVTAAKQSAAAKRIRELFTPEEEELFSRAKNAKSNSNPRNVDLYSYRLATALEAVFGYHHIRGEKERNAELLRLCYPQLFEEC